MMVFYKDEKGLAIGLAGEVDLPKIEANVVEAAVEKHVPEVSINGNEIEVVVGSVLHPMIDVHYIEAIVVEYSSSFAVKYLHPGEEPKAKFILPEGEKYVAAYAYCNLHGLWKK